MTSQAINGKYKPIYIFFFSLSIFFESVSAGGSELECNLDEMPILKDSSCADYKSADLRLNKNYKGLKDTLNNTDANLLKEKQREWIKFRDAKCQSLMEAAEDKCEENNIYCGSRIPLNIHDSCILEITSKRADDLQSFAQNPNSAKSGNYKFSKETSFDKK